MPPDNRQPIRFAFNTHGLGDVCHAAAALRLYIADGHDVQIQVEENKRLVWNAAGIPVYSGPEQLPLHPYYYLPSMEAFWDLSLPDHSSSKIAGFFDVDVLPKLGTKEQVWQRLCNERIDARPSVTPQAVADVAEFLKGLPGPIILLHSKGTNWQAEKSIPDATCFQFLCDMIGSFDGSIVVLDWDRRAPMLGHERIRSICPHWPHMSLDHFGALCMQADLLIGVDSGPFHFAQWFDIPTLFVTRKIPPVRCCLPHPKATYLVPASDHDHWAARGPEWNFAEFHGPEATVRDLVILACELLAVQSTPKKVPSMRTIDDASVPGKYIYHRVGHDQRQMELLPDGRIGEGSAGCERVWKIEQSPVGNVLTIFGEHGGPTCHLKLESDGVLRGRWLHNERMPIELIADPKQRPQPPVTVTFDDLVPVEDKEPPRESISAPPLIVPHTVTTRDAKPTAQFSVGIPTLNRYDLLEKCIDGILSGTAVPQKIYIVDNGGRLEGHPSPLVEIIRPGRNLGVAASWNTLHRMVQPSQLVIMNDDIVVRRNTLQAMVEQPGPFVTADGSQCFCVFLLRNECWSRVGQFDETFWPAYHEDNDYRKRMELAGVPVVCPVNEGYHDYGPSATKGMYTPAEMAQFNASFQACRAYYNRKWGGPPHMERFTSPFNTETSSAFDLTVITPTWQRPKPLAMQCDQIRRQHVGHLRVEHIVVSDGPDDVARGIAAHFGARYIEHARNMGAAGAYGRDTGIAAAQGRCVCFADDENALEPTALSSLYAAASGFDIGIVQCLHRGNNEWRVIPEHYDGVFRCGHVDVMCGCIRRSVAQSLKFSDEPVYDHDWRWYEKLRRDHGASVNFSDVVIGLHL